MTRIFLLIMISTSLTSLSAAVAGINVDIIRDLLEAQVLNDKANAGLKQAYDKMTARRAAHEKAMVDALQKGKNPSALQDQSMIDADADELIEIKLERAMQKSLLALLPTVSKKEYTIVIDTSIHDELIYSKSAIEDLTALVKQQLLKGADDNQF